MGIVAQCYTSCDPHFCLKNYFQPTLDLTRDFVHLIELKWGLGCFELTKLETVDGNGNGNGESSFDLQH